MALRINVRGEWLTCEQDFQRLDVRVGAGALPQTLVCPRLSTACPDLFCPFTCAGRGVCNYAHTINGTIHPKCECFDETDTSPGCSDSLLPDGDFLLEQTPQTAHPSLPPSQLPLKSEQPPLAPSQAPPNSVGPRRTPSIFPFQHIVATVVAIVLLA
jgi:hypothetical protein